jgi:hypothetical protein
VPAICRMATLKRLLCFLERRGVLAVALEQIQMLSPINRVATRDRCSRIVRRIRGRGCHDDWNGRGGPLGCKRPERSECYDDVNVEANQLCCELPTAPWPCSKGLEAANLPIVVASTL